MSEPTPDGEADATDDDPWKDEQILSEHIENGDSYTDIAAQYDDASRHSVGYYVRKYGLEPAGRIAGARWQGDRVPLVTYERFNVAFPLPVDYLAEMDTAYDPDSADDVDDEPRPGPDPTLESVPDVPDYLRFTPAVDDGRIHFDIEWGPDVTGDASNERTVLRPDTLHGYAQFPRAIAASFKLHLLGTTADTVDTPSDGIVGNALADDTDDGPSFDGTVVELGDVDTDNQRLRVTTTPEAGFYVFDDAPTDPDQQTLEPEVKPLYELMQDDRVMTYRLDLSASYADAYDLDHDDEYYNSVVPIWVDGDQYLAVAIQFQQHDDERDPVHESLWRSITHYEAGDYDAAAPEGERRIASHDQIALYPSKQLLHAVGLPTTSEQPLVDDPSDDDELKDTGTRDTSVRVIPGRNGFALIPADT
ncbi:hypothetical protein BRD11_04620 [Halobacteriales archaeon SW_12_69_24]|nr:MAG: hypothetical protein BRD11_04620 [Halobacteriales archaeon SW_12_69_24]